MGQALIKPRALSNTRSAMLVFCLNRWIALFCHLFIIILVSYGSMVNLARSQNQFENPLQHKNVLALHAHDSMASISEKTDSALSTALESGGIAHRKQFYEFLDLRRNPGNEHRKHVAEMLQLRYARRTMETLGLAKHTAKELERLLT